MEFKRFIAYIIDVFTAIIFLFPICACIILLDIGVGPSMGIYSIWGVIFCKDCFGGRSIGKRIMGYQVVDSNSGKVVSPFKSVLRNLFYILGIVDIGAMLYHSKGRRLGDYVAHTEVIVYNGTLKENKWIESIITIICVFILLLAINVLLTHYASSLGLFGLFYR